MIKEQDIQVKSIEIKNEVAYENQTIVSYTIKYPEFSSSNMPMFLKKLNSYYKNKAAEEEKYCNDYLYKIAIDQYDYSIANNYPIMKYELVINYALTYKEDYIISLYFDRYEYAGGAHGITIQYSDTWNLLSPSRVTLNQLFPYVRNLKLFLVQNIIKQIEKQISEGTNEYFEDYKTLVSEKLNLESFYLQENEDQDRNSSVIIYFQQYDIAPYVRGIVTFEIELAH